jgi:hypothetical protein
MIYQHERINPLSPMESLQDISDNGKKIVLTKLKGLFYSSNKGISWNKRK